MIKELQFMNQELWWPVLAIAFFLVLLFVWKEWKGKIDTIFVVNTMVGILAITALVLLFLRPTWLSDISGKVVLLTENYKLSQLDSLKNREKGISIFSYKKGEDFSRALDSVNEVVLLGNGLPAYDFWQLENVGVRYLKGDIPKGIVKLAYQNELRIGENLRVKGLYNQAKNANRLVLETTNGQGLDSVLLSGVAAERFQLKSEVKAKGRFIYQLTEKDSSGVILNTNPIPVEVLDRKKLRIFISNRFPSFETKYLKNFLAEQGHELVVRSQITKGRYKFEYYNTGRNPVYGFRENELSGFDLLVLDSDGYTGLSNRSKGILMKLIREDGLGVFVQPSEGFLKNAKRLANFSVFRDNGKKSSVVNNSKVKSYPYRFKQTDINGVAIRDHSYALVLGNGRLATSLLNNTYELVLAGKTDAYHRIWSDIITASAKSKPVNGEYKMGNNFSFPDEPNRFSLQTQMVKPVVRQNGEQGVALQKNTVLEDVWEGKTYPPSIGWHSLQLQNDTSLVKHFYVMDTVHWKSLIGAKTIVDNSRFFDVSAIAQVKKRRPVEVSPWWFFLVFLVSIGYLWFVPKLKA